MSALLRLLASLFPVRFDGPLIVVNVEHLGAVYNDAQDDEECCGHDPDAPQQTYVLMPIHSAEELFLEAIRRSATVPDADVAWDMARSLELGGDVA